jgi:hypothetical protein
VGRFSAQGFPTEKFRVKFYPSDLEQFPDTDTAAVSSGIEYPLLSKQTSIAADNSCVNEVEFWIRIRPNIDYVKLVILKTKYDSSCLQSIRVVGATLVGASGLEETLENLILDRTDISRFGLSILNPAVDIDDFFD